MEEILQLVLPRAISKYATRGDKAAAGASALLLSHLVMNHADSQRRYTKRAFVRTLLDALVVDADDDASRLREVHQQSPTKAAAAAGGGDDAGAGGARAEDPTERDGLHYIDGALEGGVAHAGSGAGDGSGGGGGGGVSRRRRDGRSAVRGCCHGQVGTLSYTLHLTSGFASCCVFVGWLLCAHACVLQSVCLYSLMALNNLIYGNPAAQELIADLNGVESVLACLGDCRYCLLSHG